jgi:pimeloyl-ACP methyl ester carboxylesterase
MADGPSTRYTRTSEGVYLAYQVTGDGPLDLVMPITGSTAVELIWDDPAFSRFLGRLASLARLITFDPRGFGSSGRLSSAAIPAVQAWPASVTGAGARSSTSTTKWWPGNWSASGADR